MADSTTRNTTLYRLNLEEMEDIDLRSIIVEKYAESDEFRVLDVTFMGSPALLIYGQIARIGDVEWSSALKSLVNAPAPIQNRSTAGLLIIRVDDEYFALSYGMGFLLLDGEYIDSGFGLSFMLRAVEASEIRMLSKNILDSRARSDRISVQGGQPIERFGVEYYGEMVGRVSGYLNGVDLTYNSPTEKGKKKRLSAAGSDSLKVHLGLRPTSLAEDIREIQRVCGSPAAPELKFIDNIKALKNRDPRVASLRAMFEEEIDQQHSSLPVALCLPGSCEEQENQANSYRVKIGSGSHDVYDDLDVHEILEKLRSEPKGDRFSALSSGYIAMCEDGNGKNVISGHVKAHKWLAYETSLDGTHYFFYQGSWYEIGSGYLGSIKDRVRQLFERGSTLEFPRWENRFRSENDYNKHLASKWDNSVCLDAKMIYTDQHPRGIEACDVLGPDNELVHVKRSASSAPMSHLFSQGLVSIEALRADGQARKKLSERVNQISAGRFLDPSTKFNKVIYAIALKKNSTVGPDSLFTFSQVSLVRAVTALEVAGIDVEVAPISQ